MTDKPYRLIWFHHIHKAAGSSVVKLARFNGENFCKNNNNGNPSDEQNKFIPMHEKSAEELRRFVDQCEADNVTFVATEYGGPDFEYLANDSRVTMFTCLRDPFNRFVSNFKFDFSRGRSDAETIEAYFESRCSNATPNFLSHYLSRTNWKCYEITETDFTTACNNLSHMDYIGMTESKTMLKDLAEFLGWDYRDFRVNKSGPGIKTFFRCFRDMNFEPMRRKMVLNRIMITDEFTTTIRELNKWDYELIKFAARLDKQSSSSIYY